MQTLPQTPHGVAKRHDDWDEISKISSIGRTTLQTVPNYRLYKAATQADASPPARLLLVHLIGYLGIDQTEDPKTRFVVFPGNTRLADELSYSTRSIQRLADELEAKGLLRRCYNGLNRRVGFDLTPLAMRHETISAAIVAIHTQRKQERDNLQLELSLSAERVERPSLTTNTTPQDDKSDIQNSPTNQDSAEKLFAALDGVDQHLTGKLSTGGMPEEDRTEDCATGKEARILRHLTGSGRAAHLGWSLAKKTFGFDRALALVTIANEDPKRKATTDRYFGWLLRMAMTADGHAIIEQAAARVAKKGQSPAAAAVVVKTAEEVTAENGEAPSLAAIRQALFKQLGGGAYQAWLSKVTMDLSSSTLTIRSASHFAASYLQNTYGAEIAATVHAHFNSQALKVEFRVA